MKVLHVEEVADHNHNGPESCVGIALGQRRRANLRYRRPRQCSCQNASMEAVEPTTSIFGQATRVEALSAAWRRVKSNGGGPGGDGVTLDDFAQEISKRLAYLASDLANGRYRPGRLARHRIPKASGGFRELAVPPIIDRVAQSAVMYELAMLLDKRMADESFAYRPGRSVEQALARARRLIDDGLVWIVDADIERFFDSIPHRTLLQELAIWIDDPRLLSLIGLWLSAWGRGRRGLPQGAPLSPLLANLYLHPLDRLLAAAQVPTVRYADDFILLCPSRSAAEQARQIAGGALKSRGLRLHPDKTRIVHVCEGVKFLGQMLGGAEVRAAPAISLRSPGAETSTNRVNRGFLRSAAMRALLGYPHKPCKIAKLDFHPRLGKERQGRLLHGEKG